MMHKDESITCKAKAKTQPCSSRFFVWSRTALQAPNRYVSKSCRIYFYHKFTILWITCKHKIGINFNFPRLIAWTQILIKVFFYVNGEVPEKVVEGICGNKITAWSMILGNCALTYYCRGAWLRWVRLRGSETMLSPYLSFLRSS